MFIQFEFVSSKKDMTIENLTRFGIVALEKSNGHTYSEFDFSDLEMMEDTNDSIILNLKLRDKIHHSFQVLDRCCKFKEKSLRYDKIDNMNRISCNITKDEFLQEYVKKRIPVMLTGCQESWKARNLTISSLLKRYPSKWPLFWYHGFDEDCYGGHVDGSTNKKAQRVWFCHIRVRRCSRQSL